MTAREPLLKRRCCTAESAETPKPSTLGAVTTFLLLQADPGFAQPLASYVTSLAGVDSAVVTSGPYDVVAELAASTEGLKQDILAQVRQAPGLCRLCVCQASPAQRRAAAAS